MDQKTVDDLLTTVKAMGKKNTTATLKALRHAIEAKNVFDMEQALKAGNETEVVLNQARATLELFAQRELSVQVKGRLKRT